MKVVSIHSPVKDPLAFQARPDPARFMHPWRMSEYSKPTPLGAICFRSSPGHLTGYSSI